MQHNDTDSQAHFRVATILKGKGLFKDVLHTYSSDVLPCDDRQYLMFLASHKISTTNHSYTEGDGFVESLASGLGS